MIVKKKGLYLGLLVSILSIGNTIQAVGTVQINNRTSYPIRYQIGIVSKNYNTPPKKIEGEINPEHMYKEYIDSLLLFVKAWVQRSGHSEVEAKAFKVKGDGGDILRWNMSTIGRGDGLFVVSGSDETGYAVKFRRSK